MPGMSRYPPDNFTVDALDDVGFEDWRRCDFRLSERSLYSAEATDGTAIGASPQRAFSCTPLTPPGSTQNLQRRSP